MSGRVQRDRTSFREFAKAPEATICVAPLDTGTLQEGGKRDEQYLHVTEL